MNIPNQLTVGRLGMVVLFSICMSLDFSYSRFLALVLFLVATLTDYLDGMLARRWNLETDFGKLMDPLADKILTAAAFIFLVADDLLPAWAVIFIISREFLITGLRTLASSKGIVLPAEKIGKHKTAWQMICILFFLGLSAAGQMLAQPIADFPPLWNLMGTLLIAWTTLLTVWSGAAYLWKHRSLLQTL